MPFLRRRFPIIAPCLFLTGIFFTRFLPFTVCVILTGLLAAALIFLIVLQLVARKDVIPVLLCFVLFLSFLLGTLNRLPEQRLMRYSNEEIPVTVTVRKTLYRTSAGTTAEAKLNTANGESTAATVRVILPKECEATPGTVLSGTAKISMPAAYSSSDSARYASSMGQIAFLYMKGEVTEEGKAFSVVLLADELNKRLCDRVRSLVPGESGEVICALLLGDQSGLSPSFKRDMTRIGTAHMLALSGMNVNLLILGLYHLLQCMKVHKKICYILLIPLTLAYMALTGFSVSVLRAGFMTVFTLISFLCGRTHYSFSALFASVAVICAFTPYAILNMSLWLSAASTLGILLFVSRVQRDKKKGFLAALWQTALLSLGITVSACAATLPLSAYLFGTLPIMSLPANLFLSPVLDAVLYLGVLLFLPFRIPPLCFLADRIGRLAVRLAALFSAVPHSQISLNRPVLFVSAFAVSVLILFYTLRHPRGRFRKRVPLLLLGIFCTICILLHTGEAFVYRDTLRIDYLAASGAKADFLLLRQPRFTAVIDVSSNAKSTVRAAFDEMNGHYRHEVDAYIFTDYRENLPDTLTYLCENEIVRRFYLPNPQGAEEERLFRSAEENAGRFAIPLVRYRAEETFSPAGFAFTAHRRMGNRTSTASSVCFTIEAGGKRLTYLSASCFSSRAVAACYFSCLEGSDVLFFGSYGGKNDTLLTLPTLSSGTRLFCAGKDVYPLHPTEGIRFCDGGAALPSFPISPRQTKGD